MADFAYLSATVSDLERLLDSAGLNQTEVAERLGLDSSTVSRKVSGARPWKGDEIRELLAFASERLGRRVTYEEAFGDPTPDQAAVVAPTGTEDR